MNQQTTQDKLDFIFGNGYYEITGDSDKAVSINTEMLTEYQIDTALEHGLKVTLVMAFYSTERNQYYLTITFVRVA